jgi:hypothetical protein
LKHNQDDLKTDVTTEKSIKRKRKLKTDADEPRKVKNFKPLLIDISSDSSEKESDESISRDIAVIDRILKDTKSKRHQKRKQKSKGDTEIVPEKHKSTEDGWKKGTENNAFEGVMVEVSQTKLKERLKKKVSKSEVPRQENKNGEGVVQDVKVKKWKASKLEPLKLNHVNADTISGGQNQSEKLDPEKQNVVEVEVTSVSEKRGIAGTRKKSRKQNNINEGANSGGANLNERLDPESIGGVCKILDCKVYRQVQKSLDPK